METLPETETRDPRLRPDNNNDDLSLPPPAIYFPSTGMAGTIVGGWKDIGSHRETSKHIHGRRLSSSMFEEFSCGFFH